MSNPRITDIINMVLVENGIDRQRAGFLSVACADEIDRAPAPSERDQYQGEALREALQRLERTATEVSRLGAVTGSQWGRLSAALVSARAALTVSPSPSERDQHHEKPCEHCNDTGDIIRLDGEWLGTCACKYGSGASERDQRQGETLPRLDDGLIRAALEGHYGKRAVRELGIIGVDLTSGDVNWTFKDGFTRMWAGVRKELKRRAALSPEPHPVVDKREGGER